MANQNKEFYIMKMFVRIMAFILMAGIIFIFVVVVKKSNDPNFLKSVDKIKCFLPASEITVKNKVISTNRDGNILTLLLEEDDDLQYIKQVNLCSGEINDIQIKIN